MRVIAELPFGAAGCALVPGRGQTDEPGKWIDTGRELQGVDPHVYLSEGGLREAARLLDVEVANAEVVRLKARVYELELELDEANRVADSIAGLSRPGFEVRKIRGRKPREKAGVDG